MTMMSFTVRSRPKHNTPVSNDKMHSPEQTSANCVNKLRFAKNNNLRCRSWSVASYYSQCDWRWSCPCSTQTEWQLIVNGVLYTKWYLETNSECAMHENRMVEFCATQQTHVGFFLAGQSGISTWYEHRASWYWHRMNRLVCRGHHWMGINFNSITQCSVMFYRDM